MLRRTFSVVLASQKKNFRQRPKIFVNPRVESFQICLKYVALRVFLWTRRMWFWPTWLIFLSKTKKIVQSFTEGKTVLFTLLNLFLKVLLWFCELHFWQNCHKSFTKGWTFSLRDQKISNNYTSLQKKLKRSSGLVGCSFDEFAKIATPKVWFFCSKTQTKKLEQIIFLPQNFLNLFHRIRKL